MPRFMAKQNKSKGKALMATNTISFRLQQDQLRDMFYAFDHIGTIPML